MNSHETPFTSNVQLPNWPNSATKPNSMKEIGWSMLYSNYDAYVHPLTPASVFGSTTESSLSTTADYTHESPSLPPFINSRYWQETYPYEILALPSCQEGGWYGQNSGDGMPPMSHFR
jgi:hypothetical protein